MPRRTGSSTRSKTADEPRLFSPRQVNALIGGVLTQHLPPTLHVVGEIGNLSQPASGHLYFTLKDAQAELRCVMWRSSVGHLRFEPESGMEAIATGGIEVYAPRGAYQLIVRKLEPRGVGALEVAFRQLKERLEREGLFDPQRKRELPRIPERVGLITSPSGAAILDILRTLARRAPLVEVLLFPVRVQGEGAAAEIAGAIELANRAADELGGIDVLIVARGGGSLEDSWAFNEEVVARAIAASQLPVVSGVGHEVDVTICDLVADLRAATPTAAAELIAPAVADLGELVRTTTRRATRALGHELALARSGLERRLACESLARPASRLRQQMQRIDELQQRLRSGARELFRVTRARFSRHELALLRFGAGAAFARAGQRIETGLRHLEQLLPALRQRCERELARREGRLARVSPEVTARMQRNHLRQVHAHLRGVMRTTLRHQRRLLDAREQTLASCDPRRVLKRGYSITRDARSGRILRSVAEIRERMRIKTELADGEFRSTAEDPRQPGLFD